MSAEAIIAVGAGAAIVTMVVVAFRAPKSADSRGSVISMAANGADAIAGMAEAVASIASDDSSSDSGSDGGSD